MTLSSSSLLFASWQQALRLMERPLQLHSSAVHTPWPTSSPPELQEALAYRDRPPRASLSPQWLQLPSSQQELHPQSFFITIEVRHSSVTATAAPQKSETQPRGALPLRVRVPFSFTFPSAFATSVHLGMLFSPFNS